MSFLSQGRNGHRDARNVHALVRADGPADDDGATCASRLDGIDAKPDEPVVDQDVVAGLEHLADHRRQDGQLSVHASVLASRDDDLVAVGEQHRRLELADAELGPLQVGDQRDRPAHLLLRLPDHARVLGVLLVRPVREVEACAVHPSLRERDHTLLGRARRAERDDDLRAAGDRGRHLRQRSESGIDRSFVLEPSSAEISNTTRRPGPDAS